MVNQSKEQESAAMDSQSQMPEVSAMGNQDEEQKSALPNNQSEEQKSVGVEDKNKEQESSESKKLLALIISEHLNDPDFQKTFSEHWHARTPCKTENLEVIAEPFRVCKISNFLADDEFIKHVKMELLGIETARTSMDLYQFEQTSDFKNTDIDHIKILRESFQQVLSSWMHKNTNIDLNDNVSMSSSCYFDNDYLLCHDDHNDDRRIAFILYLTKNWTEGDGGQLALFDTDENGQPGNIAKLITPEYNSLVFFEVTQYSYHQVLEILTTDKCRWSINGWFHGPIEIKRKAERPRLKLHFEALTTGNTIAQFWVKDDYLKRQVAAEINKSFENKSYELLAGFLHKRQYRALSQQVRSESISWRRAGPPDVRNYEVADNESLPPIVKNFVKFLKSQKFLLLLNWYTDLDLIPTNTSKPKIAVELQRWSNGCYTLINDERMYDSADDELSDKDESADESQNEYDEVDEENFEDWPDHNSEDSIGDVDVNKPGCSYTSKSKKDGDACSNASESNEYRNCSSSKRKNCSGESAASSEETTKNNAQPGTSGSSKPIDKDNEQHASTSANGETSGTNNDIKENKVPSSKKRRSPDRLSPEAKRRKETSETAINDEFLIGEEEAEKEVGEEKLDNEEEEEDDDDKDDEAETSNGDTAQEVEEQIKKYETFFYMIENKKAVIPFKDQFRSMTEDRDKLYDELYDPLFRAEEASKPRKSKRQALDKQLALEKQELNARIDGILEKFRLLDRSEIPDAERDAEYQLEPEDLGEKIAARESEESRQGCSDESPRTLPRFVLEVMMQFNTRPNSERQYVCYVDPKEADADDATLIRVPLKDNYLGMVYKERDVCRVQKYVDHYNDNTFYNLVCTYWENGAFDECKED